MPSPIHQALEFIVSSVLNAYIMMVMFRFCLQLNRADFYNPLSQLVVKFTNPLIVPLRKVIPGFAGIDFAAVVLMLVLQMVETFVTVWLRGFTLPLSLNTLAGLGIWSFGELLDLVLVMYLFMTILMSVLSWLPMGNTNPMTALFAQLLHPVTYPIQKRLPTGTGIDFSPLILLFCIMLTRILISKPIIAIGQHFFT